MSISTIAIHHSPGPFPVYSDRWIEYCRENNIKFKIVNCYSSSIISDLDGCSALLWHWAHYDHQALMVARSILNSAEEMGLKVFPNRQTSWHYDDKVAQKYLLEAIGAPLVRSYVFYSEKEAREWIKDTEFPKVFKLRRGAGSSNVKLVKSKREANRLCSIAFGRGFVPVSGYFRDASTKIRKTKNTVSFIKKLNRLPDSLRRIRQQKRLTSREIGYVYFQEFIPDNQFDIRITVIGERIFAFTRDVRPNDFRASGGGVLNYNHERVPQNCLTIAFAFTKRIGAQSLAFDFVIDKNCNPVIVEISYCYLSEAIYKCQGYWDSNLGWHDGSMFPEDAIISDLLKRIE